MTADWTTPASFTKDGTPHNNSAVIWDSIITSPSADHLTNLGPVALKKLVRSAGGKSLDPSR